MKSSFWKLDYFSAGLSINEKVRYKILSLFVASYYSVLTKGPRPHPKRLEVESRPLSSF